MTLGRQHALGAFIALVVAAAGVWIALNTEWVEIQVPDRVKNAVLRDRDHQLKQLATRLGANVTAPDNLDRLPPPGATLLLSSNYWSIFPERSQLLRRWVESGGHLWVPYDGDFDAALSWVPVKWENIAKPKVKPPTAAAPASAASQAIVSNDDDDDTEEDNTPAVPAPMPQPPSRCPGIGEPDHVKPVFGSPRMFSTCLYTRQTLRTSVPVQWALYGQHGQVVARVPVGQGSVTVASVYMPWHNGALLESDNALLAAATLRLHAGQNLWFVREESRQPLLEFLWTHGAPAVLLGALALAFALWRGAVRFGPRAAVLPTARRSMSEQIRGTADFVAHHGGGALHAAQLRALADAARSRVRGYDAMIVGEQAQAIARLAGMDAHTLARAMNPELNSALSRHPGASLALLETARRRLLNNAATTPSTSR